MLPASRRLSISRSQWASRLSRPASCPSSARASGPGEARMARFEIAGIDNATLGDANAGEDVFFQLGMMYSTGSTVPTDYVTAHKWFNIAAMRGNAEASRLRREIAGQSWLQDVNRWSSSSSSARPACCAMPCVG